MSGQAQVILARMIGLDNQVVEEVPWTGWRTREMAGRRGRVHVRRTFHLYAYECRVGSRPVVIFLETSKPVEVCARCGRTEGQHKAWEERGCP